MVWGQTLGFRVQGSGHGKRRLQSSYLSYSEGAGVSVRSQRTHIAIDLGLFLGSTWSRWTVPQRAFRQRPGFSHASPLNHTARSADLTRHLYVSSLSLGPRHHLPFSVQKGSSRLAGNDVPHTRI